MVKLNIRPIFLLILTTLVSVVLLGAGILIIPVVTNEIATLVTPSETCTIGVVGTAASITYTSPHAESACDQAVQSNPQQLYLITVTPTGNVMCEGNRAGYHLVVQDSGILNLEGNAICKSMLSAPSQ